MSWDEYAAAWAVRHGGYDVRRAPAPVRGWLRTGYGLARVLAVLRVRPGALTLLGLGLAGVVPLAAGRGPAGLAAAAGLVLLSAMTGTAARGVGVLAGCPAGRAGIWERVADRVGEVAWLAGCWVAGVPGVLVVACGMVTGLHEYVREQALAAGMSRVGVQVVGERPARMVVAVAGFALAALVAATVRPLSAGVLTVAIAGWLVLAVGGLGQLGAALRRSLR